MASQERVGETFVELADTLAADYDVIEFLYMLSERCVSLLDIAGAGVALADPTGALWAAASSSERMRSVELFEIQNQDGPCQDAWRSTAAVLEPDLERHGLQRWPHFTPVALAAGYASVYALPMRLRSVGIGALNLFCEEADGLDQPNQALGQAMADVATIGILHERIASEQSVLAEQLQGALQSRIVIEQAKGVISAQLDVDTETAFDLLRRYARSRHERLGDVAAAAAARTLPLDALASASQHSE